MGENSTVRQALLKLAFKHLYPGIVPNEWQPAGVLLAQVNASTRRRGATAQDALDPSHFAFRDTASAGANLVARELRIVRRKRQDPS
jgi:hypothetical protein